MIFWSKKDMFVSLQVDKKIFINCYNFTNIPDMLLFILKLYESLT